MAALDTDAEKLACMNLAATGGASVLPDIGADINAEDRLHILGLFILSPVPVGTSIGFGFGTLIISKGRQR